MTLVEYEVLVVGEKVICRDSTAGSSAYNCGTVSSLKVGFDNFIIAAITRTTIKN